MRDIHGDIVILDKNFKLLKASKIKEITESSSQIPECTCELENGKKITLPMKISQAMKYLRTICNQNTLGE